VAPVLEGRGGALDAGERTRLEALGFGPEATRKDAVVLGRARRRGRAAGRAVAAFFLGGLTTIELIALALVYMAVTGFLWLADVVEPERLFTEPFLRSLWLIVVLAMLRPLTWVPYTVLLRSFGWIGDALAPGRWVLLRNAIANLATIAVLGAVMALMVASIDGAGTAILSALAFVTGSGTFDGLGSFRGDWTTARIAAVVGGVVLLRLFLPPLDTDLGPSGQPVLGFVSGRRGRFDRAVLLAALAGAAALGALGAYLALSS
jgi:hypothetical protein